MRKTLTGTILLGAVLVIASSAPVTAAAAADADPPRITFVPNPATPPPSPTGWLRDLSPFGTFPFVVDFADPAGLRAVGCRGLIEFSYGPPTLLGTTFGFSAGVADDGVHRLDCSATDKLGNTGVGAGSTPMPVTIRIDTTPPTVTCRHTPVVRVGHRVKLKATVRDATSGSVSKHVTVTLVATQVGRFTAPVVGADVAGNRTVVPCPYITVRRGHR
jgi:hypothetical protein